MSFESLPTLHDSREAASHLDHRAPASERRYFLRERGTLERKDPTQPGTGQMWGDAQQILSPLPPRTLSVFVTHAYPAAAHTPAVLWPGGAPDSRGRQAARLRKPVRSGEQTRGREQLKTKAFARPRLWLLHCRIKSRILLRLSHAPSQPLQGVRRTQGTRAQGLGCVPWSCKWVWRSRQGIPSPSPLSLHLRLPQASPT